MTLKIKVALVLTLSLFLNKAALASNIINIANNNSKLSKITIIFGRHQIYNFFLLHNLELIVMGGSHRSDAIEQLSPLEPLPFFNSKNVINNILHAILAYKHNIHLICELIHKLYLQIIIKQIKNICHSNILSMISKQLVSFIDNKKISNVTSSASHRMLPSKSVKNLPTYRTILENNTIPVIVAIDAGHGGQDPGAIGINGINEKNITISIARKLKALLDRDKMFKPILTRNGDYFISIIDRSNIARKNGASVLLSIHADAAPNQSANGASIWILSSRRANSEMANWLEHYEKQSELLGGAGNLLASNQTELYLNQAVLDLQFGYSQRAGYDIAVKILDQLKRISTLHKKHPEHASLGVLRSPDIPSLLVETGFISNTKEEQLLNSDLYQDKIANAMYLGLRAYFLEHPLQTGPKIENMLAGI